MSELLDRAARFIDEGTDEGLRAINPVTGEFEELAEGVGFVQAFSHVVLLDAGDRLVLFDTSLEAFGPMVVAAIEAWTDTPVDTIVYTHGHVDHVGGARPLATWARERGHPEHRVIGHDAVPDRFERYVRTHGYNAVINQRQFLRRGGGGGLTGTDGLFPRTFVAPTETVADTMALRVGDLELELRHDRGETDDHLWAWWPERRAVITGDFMTWTYPNAGNPQKVQRYPEDWVAALRAMAALEPELLLPAHGLPIAGRERIRRVLTEVADAVAVVVEQTLSMMNDGATLDSIVHGVELPVELLERPYLRPVYDEPEFLVHNVWRYYGGWYDGNPARLKPASDAALGAELAALAGGATRLAERAAELAAAGDLRLACHLVEHAAQAAPEDARVHGIRADVYAQRRAVETSTMAKGIFGWASAESVARLDPGDAES